MATSLISYSSHNIGLHAERKYERKYESKLPVFGKSQQQLSNPNRVRPRLSIHLSECDTCFCITLTKAIEKFVTEGFEDYKFKIMGENSSGEQKFAIFSKTDKVYKMIDFSKSSKVELQTVNFETTDFLFKNKRFASLSIKVLKSSGNDEQE